MKKIIVIISLLVLASCTRLDDGYQFGDVTLTAADAAKRLVELRREYCDATNDTEREIALAAIRLYKPAYPKDGVCTDLLEKLESANAIHQNRNDQ